MLCACYLTLDRLRLSLEYKAVFFDLQQPFHTVYCFAGICFELLQAGRSSGQNHNTNHGYTWWTKKQLIHAELIGINQLLPLHTSVLDIFECMCMEIITQIPIYPSHKYPRHTNTRVTISHVYVYVLKFSIHWLVGLYPAPIPMLLGMETPLILPSYNANPMEDFINIFIFKNWDMDWHDQ